MNAFLKERLLQVNLQIEQATIVAVSKTRSFSVIEDVHALGVRHIGENRVEEARGKIEEAQKKGLIDIVWHMVGHVQSRKAKDVVGLFNWVDSVDSLKIARTLSSEAIRLGKTIHVLLEVNLSGEKTKYGFDLFDWEHNPDTLKQLLEVIAESMKLQGLRVEGLMTMPPYVDDAEQNRTYFRSMKALSKTICAQIPLFGVQISMGTSNDYGLAVEEGATMVRLGEILFGPRE